jgi:hypothetical protein
VLVGAGHLDVIGSASKITIAADDVMANTNAFTVSNPVIRNSVPIEIRQQWLTISKTPVGYGAVVNMTGFLGVSPDAAFFDGTTYLSGNPTQINASSANRDGSSLWGELAVRVDTLDDQVVFRGDGTGYVRRPAVGGGFTTYDMGQLFSPIALNPLLLGYTLGDVWKCPPGELAIRGYTGAFMAIGAALPFRSFINQRHGTTLADYPALYQWSIEQIEAFWVDLWDFCEVRASRRWDQ